MVDSLQPGCVIGDYELVRSIGRGGMAEVWVARRQSDRRASKYVAIKVIADQYVGDPRYQRMFHAEADLAGLLNHTNIVQVFDEGEDGGRSFLVMEWVDGANLLKVAAALYFVEDEPWRHRVIAYIVGQLLYALNYAHSITLHDGNPLGIVHRDVSPQNVLISTQGEVKLTDFGVAHYVLEESSGVHVKGKVRYMSPEQISGNGRDPRLDLYAVGAILHELLDGRRFRHHVEDQREMYLEALGGKIPPMSRAAPPELDRLRRALLEPDVDRRIQSADAALVMLSEYPGHGDARRELTELCSSVTGVLKPRVGPQGPPSERASDPSGSVPGLAPSPRPIAAGSGAATASKEPASAPTKALEPVHVLPDPVPSARLISPPQVIPVGVPQKRSQPVATVPMPGAQGAAASATGRRVAPRQSEPGEASATWTPSLARNPALPAPQTEPTEFVEAVAPSPSVPIVGLCDSALPETRLSRRPIAAPRRKSGRLMQWSLFGMAVVVLIAFGAGTVWYLFGNEGKPATRAAVTRAPEAAAAAAASRPALPPESPVVAVGAREQFEPRFNSKTHDPAPPRAATDVVPSAAKERGPAISEVKPAAPEPKAEKRKATTRRRPRSALSVAATADMGTVEIRIKSKDGTFRRNSEFSVLESIGRLPIGHYTVSWRRAGSSSWNRSRFVLETHCDLRLVIKPSGLEPKYLGTCG